MAINRAASAPPFRAHCLDIGNEVRLHGVAEAIRGLGRRALEFKARQSTSAAAFLAPRQRCLEGGKCASSLPLHCPTPQVDVRDRPAVEKAVARAAEELGGLRIMVANAGILGRLQHADKVSRAVRGCGAGGGLLLLSRGVPAFCISSLCGALLRLSELASLCSLKQVWHDVMETNVAGV